MSTGLKRRIMNFTEWASAHPYIATFAFLVLVAEAIRIYNGMKGDDDRR